MFKIKEEKNMLKKILAATALAVGLSLAPAVSAFAATSAPAPAVSAFAATSVSVPAPALSNCTYNVGSGVLVMTGTNFDPSALLNLSKVSITDGKENSYTLTTRISSTNITETPTTATINLNATDEAALTKFLDNPGTNNAATTALNGGTYQVNVYSGWDGTASMTDVSAHALTVSGVVGLTSASYDLGNGQLVITGTNLAYVFSAAMTDISPRYLTITDGATQSYTLTTNAIVKVAGGTSATITLNNADQLALQGVFSQVSSTDANYNLIAADGWNGTAGLASMGACKITVSNYSIPVGTITPATVAAGSTGGTTKVTAKAGSGDTLAYEFSASPITTPNLGTSETLATDSTPIANSIYAYTSASDIAGVDATINKYLAIYELNGTNVVKFKLFTLTSANIKVPSITAADVNGNTLTLTTIPLNTAYVPTSTAFTVKIGSKADAVTNVAISGKYVTLTLTTAAKSTDTVTVAYYKPSTSYLQDLAGNVVATLYTLKATNTTGTNVGNGFTYTTVSDLNGNTVVNVTVTDPNVTGVQVQGVAATYISDANLWRAVLTGTVTVSAPNITLTTSAPTSGNGFAFATVTDLNGNTVVNVTVTDPNVTGVQVQGVAATYNSTSNLWRAILTGTVTVSASDITTSTSSGSGAVTAIDTTKTEAIQGTFGDVYVRVYLLSSTTPASVISVTSGGTALPYSSTDGNYELDITYPGTIPSSVSVVLTTASGSQTVTVPVIIK